MTQWSKQQLVEQLPVFDRSFTVHSDPNVWESYWRFYRLDKQIQTRPEVHHHSGVFSHQHHRVVVQSWQWQDDVTRPTAIILHGYYDHLGIYGHLIEFCLTRGWNVVGWDWPGHGLSNGQAAAIDSFQTYDRILQHVLQELEISSENPCYLLGQSMGGAIATNYVLKHQQNSTDQWIKQLILFAPLVRPKGWKKIKLLHSVLKPIIRRVRRGQSHSSRDEEFMRLINSEDPLQAKYLPVCWVTALREWVDYIEAQPAISLTTILIQGSDEHTVDADHNMRILCDKFPYHVRLLERGIKHHMVNEIARLREPMFERLHQLLD